MDFFGFLIVLALVICLVILFLVGMRWPLVTVGMLFGGWWLWGTGEPVAMGVGVVLGLGALGYAAVRWMASGGGSW